ncbi:hypothetical protein LNV23_08795, partial [Paucibacter sp. DJ1R-11]|uniref:hypothetical protein n=1 Tax=Paucibacter sp. DJ1R-11 TaxID=2893556 RepID=UPI0021E419BF
LSPMSGSGRLCELLEPRRIRALFSFVQPAFALKQSNIMSGLIGCRHVRGLGGKAVAQIWRLAESGTPAQTPSNFTSHLNKVSMKLAAAQCLQGLPEP